MTRRFGLIGSGLIRSGFVLALVSVGMCAAQIMPTIMYPGDMFVSATGKVYIYGSRRLCTDLEKADEVRRKADEEKRKGSPGFKGFSDRECSAPGVLMLTIDRDVVSIESGFTINEVIRQLVRFQLDIFNAASPKPKPGPEAGR